MASREDLVRLLEAELDLIEGGGYGQSPGQPNQERPMFYQSLACINHWMVPGATSECSDDCVLMQFVPEQHRHEAMPCHFIRLNAAGTTVRSLEGNQELLEQTVKDWLKARIRELKQQDEASPGMPAVGY